MILFFARRIFKYLRELLDVDLTGLMNGNTLIYDASDQKWKPGTASGGASPPGVSVEEPIATVAIQGAEFTWPVSSSLPIVVLGGIAQMQVDGLAYEWPVSDGGPGAPPGVFDTDGVLVYFTVFGVNYQFPATLAP